MELKNVNPNGDNVLASKVNNVSFFFLLKFEICEKWVQKLKLYVIFSKRCHDCLKNKIPCLP
jgi:hypothetical protein